MSDGLRRSELDQLARARAGVGLTPEETIAVFERLRRTRLSPVHAEAAFLPEVIDGFVDALEQIEIADERARAERERSRRFEREASTLRVIERELRERLQDLQARFDGLVA